VDALTLRINEPKEPLAMYHLPCNRGRISGIVERPVNTTFPPFLGIWALGRKMFDDLIAVVDVIHEGRQSVSTLSRHSDEVIRAYSNMILGSPALWLSRPKLLLCDQIFHSFPSKDFECSNKCLKEFSPSC
jgi:hypothetical protein